MQYYTHSFMKPYGSEGYKDLPDESTPITARTLNDKDDVIIMIESYLRHTPLIEWDDIRNSFVAQVPGKGLSTYDFNASAYASLLRSEGMAHEHSNKDVIDKFSVTPSGTLYFNGKPIEGGGGGGGGGSYELPVATADVLGGIKIGDNLKIDPSSGKVSVNTESLGLGRAAYKDYVESYADRNAAENNENLTIGKAVFGILNPIIDDIYYHKFDYFLTVVEDEEHHTYETTIRANTYYEGSKKLSELYLAIENAGEAAFKDVDEKIDSTSTSLNLPTSKAVVESLNSVTNGYQTTFDTFLTLFKDPETGADKVSINADYLLLNGTTIEDMFLGKSGNQVLNGTLKVNSLLSTDDEASTVGLKIGKWFGGVYSKHIHTNYIFFFNPDAETRLEPTQRITSTAAYFNTIYENDVKLSNKYADKNSVPFSFGVNSKGEYGYIKNGTNEVIPFGSSSEKFDTILSYDIGFAGSYEEVE